MLKLTRRRLLTGLAALSALGTGGFAARSAYARYYEGPISDHFDGIRFVDPHGVPPKGIPDLLRWWTSNNRSEWPQWQPSPYADHPPTRVNGTALRVSYVGHASILLQTAGLNILIDPIWSERASPFTFAGPRRVNDPGIAFDALPPIDAVLVSHNHYDHLDVDTLANLAATHNPRVVTPLGNDAIMRAHIPNIRAEAHDWGDRITLGNGVDVTLAPMRHWSARSPWDRNKALWAAFVISAPGGGIYHVADTGYGEGHHFKATRAQFGPLRLAILPIGAYEPRWFMREQHVNPEESVRAFLDCGAEFGLGHHFGTFQLTDEAIDAPELAFAEARERAEIAPERFRALKPGQAWEL
jgi:L-ascorbate metabolism protein UlaG (beta-lactamase superfamily)